MRIDKLTTKFQQALADARDVGIDHEAESRRTERAIQRSLRRNPATAAAMTPAV